MTDQESEIATGPDTTPNTNIGTQDTDTEVVNPHSLGRQVTGLVIASIISIAMLGIGGIILALAGIFTFLDAWNSGIYKQPDKRALTNMSPMGWGSVVALFLIVGYPAYLVHRKKLKTKNGPVAYWVLLNTFALIVLLFMVLQKIVEWSGAGVA